MLDTLRTVLARALIVAGRVLLAATVLMAVWVGYRAASVTESEVVGLFVLLAASGSVWPMLLLPMASAALATTGGGITAETVLGRRSVAEVRVVHALRLPGHVWGYQVEVVLGRGRLIVASSELWEWPDDYGLGAVPQVIHPWWTGWLAMAGWMLGGLAAIALGFGLLAWLVPAG